MAGAGLLSLLDDITNILDDVATLSKVAAKKTTGIVGDDLAVNANQLVGIDPKRELPIVWKVAKGSLVNKAILVPSALAISFLGGPAAITPLLMIGGAYLCLEGVEKVFHKHEEKDTFDEAEIVAGVSELRAIEDRKVKSAIWTDFILSAEIVAVALGAVAAVPILTQAAVLGAVGLGMTVGVYSLVGGIVKLDDVGLYLSKFSEDNFAHKCMRGLGHGIIKTAPYLMNTLSVVGTAAMFMVGGGILVHGIPGAEAVVHHLAHAVGDLIPAASGLVSSVTSTVASMSLGLLAGAASIPVANKVIAPVYNKVVAPILEKAQKLVDRIRSGFGSKPENKAVPVVSVVAAADAGAEMDIVVPEPDKKPKVVVIDVQSVLASAAARVPTNAGIDVTVHHYKAPGAKKDGGPR